MATALSITPQEAGDISIRDARRLAAYWWEHPPAHEVTFSAWFSRSGSSSRSTPGAPDRRVMRPSTPDEYSQIPGLAQSRRPARKLIRLPIQIPHESFQDLTPTNITMGVPT